MRPVLVTLVPVLLAGLLVGPVGAVGAVSGPQVDPAADAGSAVSVGEMRVEPAAAEVVGGFVTLAVTVDLQDSAGLPDVIAPQWIDAPYAVVAVAADRREAVLWPTLTRVAGSETDGTWRGLVEVAPMWAGRTYAVESLHLVRSDGEQVDLGVGPGTGVAGATFSVAGQPTWDVVPDRTPVRVVSGQERWTPGITVVNRDTRQPVSGAAIGVQHVFGPAPSARLQTPPGLGATDSRGRWSGSPEGVVGVDRPFYLAYGKRGTRGWSLEDRTCLEPTVKIQANSRYTVLGGDGSGDRSSVVVEGNVWPAPVIHSAGYGPVHLQRRAADGSWQVVATANARANGRYTVTWADAPAGRHELRIRRPGITDVCGGSAGTNLASVPVTVG